VAQHEREQPNHTLDAGFIGEHRAEVGEIDLRLLPWRRLEAHLKRQHRCRSDLAQQVGHRRVATAIADCG
jgi:hypothetical protein